MSNEDCLLDGFHFDTAEEYEKALKEKQVIAYLLRQVDISDPEKALRVYQQCLSQRLFSTAIGFDFLQKLESSLLETPGIDPADVPPIPADMQAAGSPADTADRENPAGPERTEGQGGGPVSEIFAGQGGISGQNAQTAGQVTAGQGTDEQTADPAAGEKGDGSSDRASVRKARALAEKYRRRAGNRLIIIIILLFVVAAMFIISLSSDLPTIVNYKTKIINQYSSWEDELNQREKDLDQRELKIRELEEKQE